jgi:hypothetical protein
MSRPKPRRWWLASLLGLVMIGEGPTSGQNSPRWVAPTSLADPRLEPLRNASMAWESRSGPARSVVDQVCLVPDLPTFLEAVASWDEGHYFPILFDDVESSFRFIRAFKPARIVRVPKSAAPIPAEKTWARAVEVVGASWTSEANPLAYKPKGDAVPEGLGSTPPGVVLSSPGAPMLAGAVALAAGRFQPLFRIDFDRRYADLLSSGEVESFNRMITEKVRERVPNLDNMGDACDFLTIAGDWPYRCQATNGEYIAVDDRIGRSIDSDRRWAFAGRLIGGATESVYRAMCSLFLQPDSALMFNGYEESARPWSDYSMRQAAIRLSGVLPTSQVSGQRQANLEGWHESFDPINRFGLVLINSSGSPTMFNIQGGSANSSDIPRTVPSAVLMIHSFSAADPTDPSTIAGRWLANGAFVYFGAMNEPYLQSFRAPRLVGDLIGEGLPLVVAVRATLAEPYGQPWRLAFLGDPLYRIKPRSARQAPRLDRWEPTATWPAYAEAPRPSNGPDADLFLWSLKTALARLQGKPEGPNPGDDLVDTLLAIRRGRLPANYRPIFDALLAEVLLDARKKGMLRTRIAAVPEAERDPALRRTYESLLAADLHLALARKDASRARTAWSELMKTDTLREFKVQATARVGQLADSPSRRREWSQLLRDTLREREKSPDAEAIRAELKRVEALNSDR